MSHFEHDALTEKIIGSRLEVHRSLGPGFVEKIYVKALPHQLVSENLRFEVEREFNVFFKNH
jgi:GxxExxY protein